jgi:GNAT superfamily N-acetyltransferase
VGNPLTLRQRRAEVGENRDVENLTLGIRPAGPEDLPALRRVFRRSSLSNEGDRAALLAHPEALELAGSGVAEGRTRVAVSPDGTILGFSTYLPLDGRVWELEDLFVDPDWMRRGVARALIDALEAAAAAAGIASIEVTGNPHAEAFYRSVGFAHLHEIETRFGTGSRMRLHVETDEAPD